jgi:prevent-host-death family protein
MRQVNMHEAKTNLSQLVEDVMAGEEIVIARAGRPVARLVRYVSRRGKRKLGALKGQMRIAEDFDAPLPSDLLHAFEGRGMP